MSNKIITTIVKAAEYFADLRREEAQRLGDDRYHQAGRAADQLAMNIQSLDLDESLVDRFAAIQQTKLLSGIATVETSRLLTEIGFDLGETMTTRFMSDLIERIEGRME